MFSSIQETGQKCLAAVKSERDKVGVHEHKLQAWMNPEICVELTEQLYLSHVLVLQAYDSCIIQQHNS